MPEAHIVALAGALRRHTERQAARRGPGRYHGVVVKASPLSVEVAELDEPLDDDDVAIGDALGTHLDATGPLAAGDSVVLLEVDPGDYVAVEVLRAASNTA